MAHARVGVYGLGTMGSALALNLAERGFDVAVANRETDWIAPFIKNAGDLAARLTGTESLRDFVAALARPRLILIMIPSGPPLDRLIARLAPLLDRGDIVVDGGNANFNDTNRRTVALAEKGFHFVGMGVSGGAEGARHGPSMMVGGDPDAWSILQPVAEAIAARYDGSPCVAHVGPEGAGHFVKTVHNGIEYADMQMIAEVYGLLRDGARWSAPRMAGLFSDWNTGPLSSFLIETTASVLTATDGPGGRPMVDVILDRAGQKGTGRWTVIEALKLGQSASTVEAAVGARSWSSEHALRGVGSEKLPGASRLAPFPEPTVLGRALLAGRILSHAQGFAVLRAASIEFDWNMDLARIAEIWRAGCIIRSALLNELASALHANQADLPLILSPRIRAQLAGSIGDLRQVVAYAVESGLPVPALSAGLGWYDSIRQGRGTANLIQAQRDFFGAHGFERIDREGKFHGDWPGRGGQS